MRRSYRRGVGSLTVLALMVSLGTTGCVGGKKCTITGTVSYKGTPLKGGNISFVSTAGKMTIAGIIQENGSYELKNVPAGPVKICVETKSLLPSMPSGSGNFNPMGQGGGKNPPTYGAPAGASSDYMPQGEDRSKRYVKIPDKYESEKETTLTYTVDSSTKKDIDLTD